VVDSGSHTYEILQHWNVPVVATSGNSKDTRQCYVSWPESYIPTLRKEAAIGAKSLFFGDVEG
jgi:hypothetical protein